MILSLRWIDIVGHTPVRIWRSDAKDEKRPAQPIKRKAKIDCSPSLRYMYIRKLGQRCAGGTQRFELIYGEKCRYAPYAFLRRRIGSRDEYKACIVGWLLWSVFLGDYRNIARDWWIGSRYVCVVCCVWGSTVFYEASARNWKFQCLWSDEASFDCVN